MDEIRETRPPDDDGPKRGVLLRLMGRMMDKLTIFVAEAKRGLGELDGLGDQVNGTARRWTEAVGGITLLIAGIIALTIMLSRLL